MTETATTPDTLPAILRQQASLRPRAPALWWQGQAISYANLWQRSERAARRLATVGATGDRIAVLSWNSPQFMELIYALPLAGRILVPLNARLAQAEWRYQLEHTDCHVLLVAPDLLHRLNRDQLPQDLRIIVLNQEYEDWLQANELAQLPAIGVNDIAWILFTSGSTGRPKGAMLSHAGFMAGLVSAAQARPVELDDRYYYPFPLFHVAAHNVLLQHRYGASVVLSPAFDAADTLQACRTLGVTTMSLAPTMIAMMLDHPDFTPNDLAGVRTIGYGASAMPSSLLQRLLTQTHVGLCQSYGMTELCGSVAFLTVQDHRRAMQEPQLLASVGKPLPTADIRLVNDAGQVCDQGQCGEIVVRAEQCMLGYWRDEQASATALRDGWLYTGDIGRFDGRGNLYIVDRKKDMVISGGENIASREVEEALRQHDKVKDCAVIGIPDARWGEALCALVVPVADVQNEELAQHCRSLLAGYKTPKHWVRLDTLPLNASGKVDKPLLRERYRHSLEN